MVLLLTWILFIFVIGLAKELDQIYYFCCSVLMLYFTYLCDQALSAKFSLRMNLFLLTIPSIIFWYIMFVYNNFLCLTPVNHEILVSILFFHTYVVLYIFWEFPKNINNKLHLKRF